MLNLLLTDKSQLLDCTTSAHLRVTRSKVSHDASWLRPSRTHCIGIRLELHNVRENGNLRLVIIHFSVLFRQVEEELLVFEVDWGHSVVRVLLVTFLLEVAKEAPA